MIYFDEKYKFYKEKVIFTYNGKKEEKYIGSEGRSFYQAFEKKWENMKILSFEDIKPTKAEIKKLETVNKINPPKVFISEVIDYVKNGKENEIPVFSFNHLRKQKDEKETTMLKKRLENVESTINSLLVDILPNMM